MSKKEDICFSLNPKWVIFFWANLKNNNVTCFFIVNLLVSMVTNVVFHSNSSHDSQGQQRDLAMRIRSYCISLFFSFNHYYYYFNQFIIITQEKTFFGLLLQFATFFTIKNTSIPMYDTACFQPSSKDLFTLNRYYIYDVEKKK